MAKKGEIEIKNLKKIGVYIHIPFCLSKCRYCDFYSIPTNCCDNSLINDYIISLIKQIKNSALGFKNYEIDTIYIGGGTPSLLPSGAITTIMKTIRDNYNINHDAEISIEGNPNSITNAVANEWKSAGINRASIGVQTLNKKTLEIIGRVVTKEQVVKAITSLQMAGINNINCDFMIGLPKQKISDIKKVLNLAIKLNVKHISCYSLILEENTPLHKDVLSGLVKLPDETKVVHMYNYVNTYLKKHNIFRYEVSNFAYSGYECKHNIHCWELQEYVGFGVNSKSDYKGLRRENANSIKEFNEMMKSNEKIEVKQEELNISDRFEETIMLGLRMVKGINLEKLKADFGLDYILNKFSMLNILIKDKLLEVVDGNLRATDLGFYVLNYLIACLTLDLDENHKKNIGS